VKFRLSAAPQELLSGALFNAAWLCGIGFTMSLFIATLAFGEGTVLDMSKIGKKSTGRPTGLVVVGRGNGSSFSLT